MSAVRPDGTCIRCGEGFGHAEHCHYCGVAITRVVRYIRRRRIGGKRGRNSGAVGTAKNK